DDANPLRYYLYKEVTLEGAEAAEQPAPVEPAEAEVTEEAAPVEEAAPAPVTVAENKTTEAAPAAAEEKKNETAEPAKTEPGFESIFAITGLLAVAYLVLGRRE
ncbi:MAG TPA: PGF-CTERM sorting domain-containing protein, partial [Methanothrix sp.]|nr:PGF-CTERM sorting domain-containing protein [Methanothrix sp.]